MLEVLDTAGQEEFVALRDQWIRDGEGFVLVYAINSRPSFALVEKYYAQIQRVKESAASAAPSYPGAPSVPGLGANPHAGPAPVMVVANKCDKVTERAVSTQEGQALAKSLGCDFVEASAKNRINVEAAFYDVVRALRRQRGTRQPTSHKTGKRPGRNKGDKLHRSGSRSGKGCVIL